MGVYIEDMDMPKACQDCCLFDDGYDYPRCRVTDERKGYPFDPHQHRMSNCPLKPERQARMEIKLAPFVGR